MLEGIHIHRHPLTVEADSAIGYALEYGLALFWQFVLSVRIALTRGFDVIQACNPPDTIFLVGGFFKLFGKRFIFDHHDINPELYEAKFGRRDIWYRLVVLAGALDVRHRRREHRHERIVSPHRHRTRRHGSGTRVRGSQRPRPRAAAPAGRPREELRMGKRYLVGYVGVIGKQEGLDLLLESIAYMRRELGRNDVHFAIVGGGTEVPALRAMARALGLEDCVQFTGRVPDELLWDILGTADICVNPDRANEMNDKSTMNKILEYMALAKPIVQFDLTEGRYSAGDASLYAKPNDTRDFAEQLSGLLDNPERRRLMGESGRARIERQFAWHHQVPRLLAAYEAVFDWLPPSVAVIARRPALLQTGSCRSRRW